MSQITSQSTSAFSIKPGLDDATRQCSALIEASGPRGDSPLGFLYLSGPHATNARAVVEEMTRRTGISNWVGTTGHAVCVDDREFHDGAAIAALVLDLNADDYRIISNVQHSVEGALLPHRDWIAEKEARFGVIHADPRNNDLQQQIQDLSAGLDHGYLVGGLSSSEDAFMQIANTTSGGVTQGDISGVLFAASVSVATGLSQGCAPISGRMRVTLSEANAIHELDDRPALEVLQEILGHPTREQLPQQAGATLAALTVPGTDTGDYVVRHLQGIDTESNTIWITDDIPTGSEMMFCQRNTEAARSDLVRMAKSVRERAVQPSAALYHTCLARGPHLFGRPGEELEILQAELGDIPLAGFFGNGEICHNRLYAYTGVLTVL